MFTSSQYVREKNQDATIYVGNITDQANEELLWELFLQVRFSAGRARPGTVPLRRSERGFPRCLPRIFPGWVELASETAAAAR